MNVSNLTLMKIASIGGFATVSMGLLLKWKASDNLSKTETYNEVLSAVKQHSGAVNILGEPIRPGTVDVENKNNYVKNCEAHFEIPVKGPKKQGIIHFWANKIEEKWNVQRIELELQGDKNKGLVIKSTE